MFCGLPGCAQLAGRFIISSSFKMTSTVPPVDKTRRWIAADTIRESSLHSKRPVQWHIYGAPFCIVYCGWLYVYVTRYDDLLGSSEFALFTFMLVAASHALSFLVCQWSVHAKVFLTCNKVTVPVISSFVIINTSVVPNCR